MAQYDLLLTQNVHATLTEYSEKFVNVAKGGLISAITDQTPTVLAGGTDGYILARDDVETTGLKWIDPSTLGVTVTNQGNDRVVTSTATTDTLNAETGLTYNTSQGLLIASGIGIVFQSAATTYKVYTADGTVKSSLTVETGSNSSGGAGDVTIKAGAGTSVGGNVYFQRDVTYGNFYFGTGAAGHLPAKSSETNVIFYDSATGKISYGAAGGDVSWGTPTNYYLTWGDSVSGNIGSNSKLLWNDTTDNLLIDGKMHISAGTGTGDHALHIATNEDDYAGLYISQGGAYSGPTFLTSVGGAVNHTIFTPNVDDGATAIAYEFDTYNTLSIAGAKLVSVSNNTTEKFFIDLDGNVDIEAGAEYRVNGVAIGTGSGDVSWGTAGSGQLAYGSSGGDIESSSQLSYNTTNHTLTIDSEDTDPTRVDFKVNGSTVLFLLADETAQYLQPEGNLWIQQQNDDTYVAFGDHLPPNTYFSIKDADQTTPMTYLFSLEDATNTLLFRVSQTGALHIPVLGSDDTEDHVLAIDDSSGLVTKRSVASLGGGGYFDRTSTLLTTTNAGDNIAVDTASKIYFDGGVETYIHQPTDDVLTIVVGNSAQMTFYEGGAGDNAEINCELTLNDTLEALDVVTFSGLGSDDTEDHVVAIDDSTGLLTKRSVASLENRHFAVVRIQHSDDGTPINIKTLGLGDVAWSDISIMMYVVTAFDATAPQLRLGNSTQSNVYYYSPSNPGWGSTGWKTWAINNDPDFISGTETITCQYDDASADGTVGDCYLYFSYIS